MRQQRIHWDAENTHHILVEHADRRIGMGKVEEVLLGRNTLRWMSSGGRFVAQGRTAAGRCLRVIHVGVRQMRPVTAWQRPGRECERWGI
jgi:hypothetical protein